MDKQNETFSLKRRIAEIAIFVYCGVILACVALIMLFKIEPEVNSPGAWGSACMDFVCIIVLIILIVSRIVENKALGRTARLFLLLMLATEWALFFDFLTWSSDGSLVYGGWTYVFTIASLCSGAILGAIFVLYLSSYLDDMYGLKKIYNSARVCVLLNIIAFVLTMTLALTNTAFVFVEGHYETGVLYDAITVLPILTLIYMSVYAIAHGRTIGVHDAVAVAIYISIMITGAIIEALYGIGATYVSVSIADVTIFVMLQNNVIARTTEQKNLLAEKVDEEKKNVEKWMKKSNTDEVTGFYNRHAYEADIMALAVEELKDDFVYISVDVNGLKIVNDTLGHDAGDELIAGAGDCMRKCFGSYGKLYRTGGDEFAALLNMSAVQFDNIKNDLLDITGKWHGKLIDSLTLSCGYVSMREVKGMSIREIAGLADKRMYENKTTYYQKRGIDRRGQRDAHVALCALYTKILKINVVEDTYQIVNLNSDEKNEEMGFSTSLSAWMHDFATKGLVHPDDLDGYLEVTNPRKIEEHFSNAKSPLRVFYRRKIAGDFMQVMMEIIPANDYKADAQNLFLYVKNIDNC